MQNKEKCNGHHCCKHSGGVCDCQKKKNNIVIDFANNKVTCDGKPVDDVKVNFNKEKYQPFMPPFPPFHPFPHFGGPKPHRRRINDCTARNWKAFNEWEPNKEKFEKEFKKLWKDGMPDFSAFSGFSNYSKQDSKKELDEMVAFDKLIESIVKSNPVERLQKAIELGILYDEESAKIREQNGGKSNYSHRLIQPWAIYEENPQLNYLECDIIKRLLRTKEETGLTMTESRMLDIQKIKHIVTELERVYKIKLAKEKKSK